MSVENILNNDEYKLIFLKAIILGISYGKSDNSEYYNKSILNEISKINTKININTNNTNNILGKYEIIISNLENQRKNIINLINNLSSNNYGSNYSRINLLKSNLILINNEIDKNKNILKMSNNDKKNISTNSMQSRPTVNMQSRPAVNIQLKQNINSKIPLQNPITEIENQNLVNELEKTLGGLSNLLIS